MPTPHDLPNDELIEALVQTAKAVARDEDSMGISVENRNHLVRLRHELEWRLRKGPRSFD